MASATELSNIHQRIATLETYTSDNLSGVEQRLSQVEHRLGIQRFDVQRPGMRPSGMQGSEMQGSRMQGYGVQGHGVYGPQAPATPGGRYRSGGGAIPTSAPVQGPVYPTRAAQQPVGPRPSTAARSAAWLPKTPVGPPNRSLASPISGPQGSAPGTSSGDESSSETPSETRAFAISSEHIMKWAGVSLVSFAAFFLLRTALRRGWVGPEVQLLTAAFAGYCMHGSALWLRNKRPSWAAALSHGGAAITAACAIAAHQWLDLVTTAGSLGLVAMATLASVGVAIWVKSPLTFVTVASGWLGAGLVLDVAAQHSPGLAFGWIAIAAVGGLTASWLPRVQSMGGLGQRSEDTGWRIQRLVVVWLAALVLFVTAFWMGIVAAWSDSLEVGLDGADLLVFGVATVVIAVAAWVGPLMTAVFDRNPAGSGSEGHESDQHKSSARDAFAFLDHRAVLSLPMWMWLTVLAPLYAFGELTGVRAGLIGGALTVAFVLAAMLSRRLLPPALFVSHLFGASALASASLVVALDGPVLLVTLAIQAVALTFLGSFLGDNLFRLNGFALLSLASTWTLIDLLAAFGEGVEFGSAVVYFTVAAAGMAVARINVASVSPKATEATIAGSWIVFLLLAGAWASGFLFGYELLLVASAAAVASVAVKPWFGAMTAAVGQGIAGLAVVVAASAMLTALVDQASVLEYAGTASVLLVLAAGSARPKLVGSDMATASTIVAWFGSMLWVVSLFVHAPQGQLIVSSIWAVAAVAAITAGIVYDKRTFQMLGMTMFAIVLLKLFTVDLQVIDVLWRVGLFAVLGIGFLFLGYRLPALSRLGQKTE